MFLKIFIRTICLISFVLALFFSNSILYGEEIRQGQYPINLRQPLLLSSIKFDALDNLIEAHLVRGHVRGQDNYVIGYSDRLLLTDKAKKDFKGIFYFDVDKTLADRDAFLPEGTIQLLEMIARLGYLIVIPTGQPINIQRPRVISPIDPTLRRNFIILTNEGITPHHFLPTGEEYVVFSEHVKRLMYTPEQKDMMQGIVEGFMFERGFEYAPAGEPEDREGGAQFAFKLLAGLETREGYAMAIGNSVSEAGITGFRGWASGSTTISFLHKDADKRRAGIGFIKVEGLGDLPAVFAGDEFFPGGNDYVVREEDGLFIAIVGDTFTEDMLKRPRTFPIGGGPFFTQRFLKDAVTLLMDDPDIDFSTAMEMVSEKHVDLEKILSLNFGNREKAFEAIINRYGYNKGVLKRVLSYKCTNRKDDFLDRIDPVRMNLIVKVIKDCRVGRLFIGEMYQYMFGHSLEDDFESLKGLIKNEMLSRNIDIQNKRFLNARGVVLAYKDLFDAMFGVESNQRFKDGISKLVRQDQIWKFNENTFMQVKDHIYSALEDINSYLIEFFSADTSFSWVLTSFGNRLEDFNEFTGGIDHYIGIEQISIPSTIDNVQLEERLKKSTILSSGGGGIGSAANATSATGIHLINGVQNDNERYGVGTVDTYGLGIVGTVDDGGSSGVAMELVYEDYGIKIIPMGDPNNSIAQVSRSTVDYGGDPLNRWFFYILRDRFPADIHGMTLLDGFSTTITNVLQDIMHYSEIDTGKKDMIIRCLKTLYPLMKKFDIIPIENQSLGNLIWLAVANEVLNFRDTDQKTMSPEDILKVQLFMSETFGIDKMLVIPAAIGPSTMYAIVDNLVYRDLLGKDDKPIFISSKELEKGFAQAITLKGHSFSISESIGDDINVENGYTIVEYELKDGEELTLQHTNKENVRPFLGESTVFRASVKRVGDAILVRHNIGAEEWSEWRELEEDFRVVGLDKADSRESFPAQSKWGSRIAMRKENLGMKLRVWLDRVGSGTLFIFNDARIEIKGRLTVKQTNITEQYRDTIIKKTGIVQGTESIVNPYFIKALQLSEAMCIIGPGSTATSITPQLLYKEVQQALRDAALRGLMIAEVFNPYSTNEEPNATVEDVMQMREDSCGTPIYGIERGGFINVMLINDPRLFTDRMLNIIEGRVPSNLRPAERPRGIFRMPVYVRKHLEETYSGLQIVVSDLASLQTKEVRGSGGGEEGVIYSSNKLGNVIESTWATRNRELIEGLPLFQEVASFFNGDNNALFETIRLLKIKTGENSDLKALYQLWQIQTRKAELTKVKMKDIYPSMIVVNAGNALIDSSYVHTNRRYGVPFRKDTKEAITRYVHAGGNLVITTGYSSEQILESVLNELPVDVINKVYVSALSGGEIIYKGEKFSLKDFLEQYVHGELYEGDMVIPDIVRNIIKTLLLKVYFSGVDERSLVDEHANFINIRLNMYNDLSIDDLEEINYEEVIPNLQGLSEEEKALIKLDELKQGSFFIKWQQGWDAGADFREHFIELLRTIISMYVREGTLNMDDLTITKEQENSIDVKTVIEHRTLDRLIRGVSELKGIPEQRILIVDSAKVDRISETHPGVWHLSIPDINPESIFNNNSFINALGGTRTYTWGVDECNSLLNAAAEALELRSVVDDLYKVEVGSRATKRSL